MFMGIPPIPKKRGSVAIRQADSSDGEKNWLGVFINEKSNPIEFGSQLWYEIQDHWKSLDRFATNLLKCGYWDEYKNGGLCQYCGKFGVGQPNTVSGYIFKLVQENEKYSMAPDPNSVYHNHIKPQPRLEAKNAIDDGLWIEWVYIIDPKTYSLEILKAVRAKGFHNVTRLRRHWEQENYQYVSVALCSLFNDEPNWDIVEQRGLNMAEYYFGKATPPLAIAFNSDGEN
jgi:hypothetical protein